MTHAADDDAAFWDDPHGAFETKASYELAEGLSAMHYDELLSQYNALMDRDRSTLSDAEQTMVIFMDCELSYREREGTDWVQ
jgi:hypothetical protein